MMRLFAAGLGCALLVFFSGVAAAAELSGAALAREASVQMYLLRIETSMIVYDETSDVYVKQARALLEGADASIKSCVRELAKTDAATAASVAENWRVVGLTLRGGGEFGDGIFNIGYDAATHGYFDDNAQKLHDTLEKTYGLSGGKASLESRAYLLAARTVANYIQASANPFGSYTNSFNTEDSDTNVLVTRLDKELAELATKYRNDKERSEKARRINAKWQFIRTTILKVGKQSTPMIVYKHGGDIIRELKTFN